MMYYIPNIVIIGYGKTQVYQCQCLKCKTLYFNLADEKNFGELFCEDCYPTERLLRGENKSDFNYVGNIKGWVIKGDTRFKRSRKNYNQVYKRDKYTCQYCGYSPTTSKEFRPLHIDHVRPYSSGGSNDMDNLVVACQRCNLLVNDKWFDCFQDKKRFILQEINKK